MLKLWTVAALSALVGSALAIAAMQARAQSPAANRYKVVFNQNIPAFETVINEGARAGWRLHSVAGPLIIFERQ
jgi:hypothetical protein